MAFSAPASLRDLYSDSSTPWSFTPPGNSSLPASGQPSKTPDTSLSRPIPWSHRPVKNDVFDLAPSLGANGSAGISPADVFSGLLASALIQYTSSAIAMPWEVGKLLLQVQWVPRHPGIPEQDSYDTLNDEESDDSNDDDASYFAEPNAPTVALRPSYSEDVENINLVAVADYIIPVGSADGVWGMIKRITRFREEGWLALWKGLLTSCITDVVSYSLQPSIQSVLQSIFLPPLLPFHQPPILFPITAHLMTGFIVSPLDLIRTRLIAQSSSPQHRMYSGPIDAFRQIYRDEGGLHGMYMHPTLFIPTLIDSVLRPIVSLALPGLLASYLGIAHITPETYPIAWGFVELAGSCLGLLITLPFETIRRRLQVQPRGNAKLIKGCVQLRPMPYNGVVDAFWHILTEERSDLPILYPPPMVPQGKGKRREESPVAEKGIMRNTGLGQLYRGLGMRLGASVIVFLLSLVSGEDHGSGWAEL